MKNQTQILFSNVFFQTFCINFVLIGLAARNYKGSDSINFTLITEIKANITASRATIISWRSPTRLQECEYF